MPDARRVATAADWDGVTIHELPSGKTVELVADPPNIFGLAARFGIDLTILEGWTEGAASVSELNEIIPAVCMAMFASPRVSVRGKTGKVPDGHLDFERLSDDDVAHVLDAFLGAHKEAVEQTEQFLEDGDGTEPGEGSADVEVPAKPARRPADRKPKGRAA